jgi:antitoxin component YwqK of YwqJK toxin-antitoxin module
MSHVKKRGKSMKFYLTILILMLSTIACSDPNATPCDKVVGTRFEGKMPPVGKEWACVLDQESGPVRHGPSARYFSTGTMKDEHTYEVGIKHGPYKLYFDNGQIKETGIYKYGLQNGRFTQYYPNGKLKAEGTYADGKLSGKYKHFSDTGNAKSEGWYLMGYKNGEWINSYTASNGRELKVKQNYYYGDIVTGKSK